MRDSELEQLAAKVGRALQNAGLSLVTAESCTGGWVGEAVTAIAGSSDWFDRGFVTYSNAAKREVLGIAAATLDQFGAVSEETAREMALGALKHSHAQISVAVTGIAGPGGGSVDKPVGTVCFAWANNDTALRSERHVLPGDRTEVRRQSVVIALRGIIAISSENQTARA
ncbi:MAG: nicotinamide-nucleotide amidohydrolase family protein [Pseudomonadota bacterium]|nr:nicotinamide-nucleotide amidohydrolase family protein [Pseudomonadota bacterium]